MIDQATELRKLVLQSVQQHAAAAGPPPRLVVAASGKPGVGVTTLAVNLSAALAEQGSRVVLVETGMHRSDMAALCGVPKVQGVIDAVAARRDLHELLRLGPAGVRVLAGGSTTPGREASSRDQTNEDPTSENQASEAVQQRLLVRLNALGRHADVVVLDVGAGAGGLVRRCVQASDHVLVVTTASAVPVMDCYARVKSWSADGRSRSIQLVVNRSDRQTAGVVHQRIDHSCRRFLGFGIERFAAVPEDDQVPAAASRGVPFVLGSPQCPAAHAIARLAAQLLSDRSPGQKQLLSLRSEFPLNLTEPKSR